MRYDIQENEFFLPLIGYFPKHDQVSRRSNIHKILSTNVEAEITK